MKKINFTHLLLIALAVFTFSACDESGPEGTDDGYGYEFTDVIDVYVDQVVLSTYTDMKNKSWDLYDAVINFMADQNQDNLDAVCAAWRANRVPWEQSEGFLFGPAALLSLDPSLDSWPLDKTQIDNIINNSSLEITSDAIASSNVHGFHTIEYLIFSNGNPKDHSVMTDREIEYLFVAVEYLRNDCLKLWSSWNGSEGISEKDRAVLDEIEFEPAYNFAAQFKSAGNAGSTFLSQDDAIDQIVDGCVDIASEVGSQKIGGPNASRNVLDVESWYSWNSIDDYANNVISIRNSYFGGRGKTASDAGEHSLSAFVKSKNADLDAEITAAIETAYVAINNGMDRPFRNNLTGENVDAAMEACADLETAFQKIKTLRD